MAFIAIIHVPGHTADAVRDALSVLPSDYKLVAVHEFAPRLNRGQGCLGCAKGKMVGWARHRKGYMVCGTCGKRNPNVRRWFRGALFDWFGANIMGDDAPALFRTPDGYSNDFPHADND